MSSHSTAINQIWKYNFFARFIFRDHLALTCIFIASSCGHHARFNSATGSSNHSSNPKTIENTNQVCPEKLKKYPDSWWQPIFDRNPPAWEILPQEAKPNEVILSKRNELGILSNFANTPFDFAGKRYASVEGFWQMMLYPEGDQDPRLDHNREKNIHWIYTREQVSQMSSFEAKQAGEWAEANMQKLAISWVSFNGERFPYRTPNHIHGRHYELIKQAMWEKLQQNPIVKNILCQTGNLILKPDHIGENNPPDEWHYYDIWMELRQKLQRSPTTWHH